MRNNKLALLLITVLIIILTVLLISAMADNASTPWCDMSGLC